MDVIRGRLDFVSLSNDCCPSRLADTVRINCFCPVSANNLNQPFTGIALCFPHPPRYRAAAECVIVQ